LFQCRTTKLCISSDKVCDRHFDCGYDDSSDEADCPCQVSEEDSQSSYLRPILIPLMSLKCYVKKSEVDTTCLREAKVDVRMREFKSRVLDVISDKSCGLSDCNLSHVELIAGQTPLVTLGGEEMSRTGGKFVLGRYSTGITLPLAAKNWTYHFTADSKKNSSEMKLEKDDCVSKWITSEVLVERMFASIMLKASSRQSKLCQCDASQLGRLSYFNHYHLPSPYYQDASAYYHDKVRARGQFELLYTTQFDCRPDQYVYEVRLNDFYPSVSFSSGRESDKNYPVLLHFVSPIENCRVLDEDAMRLWTIMTFANGGSMKTKEGQPWITVSNGTLRIFRAILCSKTRVFEFVYSEAKLTFLVAAWKGHSFQQSFEVANQQFGNHLSNANFSKLVTVNVQEVTNKELFAVGNKHLFHEIFTKSADNMALAGRSFYRLYLPRHQRDYVQKSGESSILESLSAIGIQSNSSFFKLCSTVTENNCSMTPIKDKERIATVLSSRWSRSCLNIELQDSNVYSILPSKVDTIFIMLEPNETKLVKDPNQVTKEVTVNAKLIRGDDQENISSPQTKLVRISGQMVCENELILEYPSFYVTALISALMNNNSECLTEICEPTAEVFKTSNGFSFLGPFESVWKSSCFKEFGYDLVENIFKAKENGILTLNKFWAFDHYDFLIYSSDKSVNQVESIYLSNVAYGIEIALTILMTMICVITVAGNALVCFAISIDSWSKKSVYQYLQISLCLADITMGLAGAGSILYIQIGLLKGYINIYDFIDEDVFTSTFDNPQEASRSGLNQFYFITSSPGLVICGALVR
jgi:hypothetical protein